MANLHSILGKTFVIFNFCGLDAHICLLVLDLGVVQTPREVLLGPVILCSQLTQLCYWLST